MPIDHGWRKWRSDGLLVEVGDGGPIGRLLAALLSKMAVLIAAVSVRPVLTQVLGVGGGIGRRFASIALQRLGVRNHNRDCQASQPGEILREIAEQCTLTCVGSTDSVERIWDAFCTRFEIAERCVPLFAEDSQGNVSVKEIGVKPRRPVLERAEPMESMVLRIAQQLVDDYNNNLPGERQFDGMLYMMGWKEGGRFLPLYIGKTETLGRKDSISLSENLKGLSKSGSKMKFARWGDNYEYHIGDLSSWVLPEGHTAHKKQNKYERWAKTLFEPGTRKLRRPTYFWATAWKPTDTSIWEELGPTTLAVTEYLVIGVAGKISPDHLLNRDGIPRQLLEWVYDAAGND